MLAQRSFADRGAGKRGRSARWIAEEMTITAHGDHHHRQARRQRPHHEPAPQATRARAQAQRRLIEYYAKNLMPGMRSSFAMLFPSTMLETAWPWPGSDIGSILPGSSQF
jgi:hypothetical protein